jgi:hypothetical protein
MMNRFLPPTSLKKLEDVLQECYEILLETVQNLYESIPRIAVILKAKVSVVFPLFCPASVCDCGALYAYGHYTETCI